MKSMSTPETFIETEIKKKRLITLKKKVIFQWKPFKLLWRKNYRTEINTVKCNFFVVTYKMVGLK